MTTLTQAPLAVANPWSLVPPLGNLDAYISAVNRLPMLTLEQEQEFARKLKDENDLEAAGKLVLSHLRLVVSVSRQYLGYGLPHADLIQEGNVGLMKAVKRFDPDQGVRLVSYAMHWIKAEIHEYILKNWRMVKVATTKAQRKLFFNLRSMKQGFKADASAADATASKYALRPGATAQSAAGQSAAGSIRAPGGLGVTAPANALSGTNSGNVFTRMFGDMSEKTKLGLLQGVAGGVDSAMKAKAAKKQQDEQMAWIKERYYNSAPSIRVVG